MARVQAKKTQVQEQTKTQPKAKPQPQQKAKEQTSEVVFAMDIGTRSIIGMVGVVEDEKVRIIAVEKEDHLERAMIDGQIENIEKVSGLAGKVKKRLEDKTGFKLTRVCVAAAGRALGPKRADFELELAGTQLIDDEIISRLEAGAITRAEEAFDAENEAAEDARRFYLVGYTVCQYYLDQYMISNLKDHRGRHVKVDLIATFLPSEVVESLYTTMNKIGLEVASLTLEPIAAINAAIPENIRLLNLVLVDIGAGTSDIAACTGGSITGYTMATVAGDEITETIMKEYLVDFSTAEDVKARLDLEEEIAFTDILGMEHRISRDDIFQCIQGTSGFLCKEIADKVLEINGSAPSALFLAGGGSKLAGLKEGLTTALGIDPSRVAIAGNYFKANAFSDEYDLNNPEYATPLGIAVSSGLNMINDSFRVILNGRPAKLFRSGSFTALNLLMMNGYNFRDLLGRAGQNLTVMVNGARKVFYGTSSEPAVLLINQKEGKLSDIIHAGDVIDFVPAIPGEAARACLGDVEGAKVCVDVTLNGIHVPLKTPLKSGDVIHMILPKKADTDAGKEEVRQEENKGAQEPVRAEDTKQRVTDETETAVGTETETEKEELTENAGMEEEEAQEAESSRMPEEEVMAEEEPGKDAGEIPENRKAEAGSDVQNAESRKALVQEAEIPDTAGQETEKTEIGKRKTGSALERLGRMGVQITPVMSGKTDTDTSDAGQEEAEQQEPAPIQEKSVVVFQLNGSPIELPKKEDGRPYYLMDMIQYSGIDLEHPKGVVKLTVNGAPGMFRQPLSNGDTIYIGEEKR